MPNLDFDAELAERRRVLESDPLTYTLGGRTFRCIPMIPVPVLLALAESERAGGGTVRWEGWRRFLIDVTVPEQRDEVDAAITESGIDVRGLDNISTQLAVAYSGRPTSPSLDSGSPSGPSGDGETSQTSPTDEA